MTTVVLEHLQHANSGSPDLTIDANGFIGVGTASPARPLSVVATGNTTSVFERTDGTYVLEMKGSGTTSPAAFGMSGNDLVALVNNSERLRVDSNGNIGIGTTTPTFATIDGYTQRGIEISGAKESGTAPVIKLTETGSGKGAFEIRSNREGLTSGNYLAFGENTDTFMVIRGDDDGGGTARRGNVGIGTTNPFNKLQIGDGAVGGLENAIGILTHYGNQNTALGKIRWHDGANVTGQIHTQYDGSSVDMHFGHLYNGGYDTTSDLIIKGNGAVNMPNQPSFKAYKSGSSFTLSTDNVFVWDNTEHNVGNMYNTSNGRMTAPISGVYQINFYSIHRDNITNGWLSLRKNGARFNGGDVHYSWNMGNAWGSVGTSMTVKLVAGDYLSVYAGATDMFHGGFWSGFSGYLVG
jgi:hypothetical protein